VVEPNIGTVVGQIACGEHHTSVLTSTPWNRVHPEVAEWIALDQTEYEKKLKCASQNNHGLYKQDLSQIQTEMQALKERKHQEKEINQAREEKETALDIASILSREEILQQIMAGNELEEPDLLDADTMDEDRKKGAIKKKTTGLKKLQQMGLNLSPGRSGTGSGGDDFDGRSPTPRSPSRSKSGAMTERKYGKPVGELGQRATFLKESGMMVKRMKTIIANTGESSSESQLKRMKAVTFDFRKEYDALKAVSNKRLSEYEESRQSIKAMKKNKVMMRECKKLFETRLKALEMKLNTVTIKIAETEENRRNYALNIAHLKEEELERYYQLEALRNKCAEYDNCCKKLNELKLLSLDCKNRSEAELSSFQKEIAQFQGFISDQLGKFQSISAVSRHRRERREQMKQLRTHKAREKIEQRITKLEQEMEETNNEAQDKSQQLDSVNERLRYFENRFQQIASATGLTNPEAIINKFALKEEIMTELNQEISSKKQTLEELKAELERLQADKKDFEASFQNSNWKDVHELQTDLSVLDARAQQKQKEASRLEELLASFQEGLLNLANGIPDEFGQALGHSTTAGSFDGEAIRGCLDELSPRLDGLLAAVTEAESQAQVEEKKTKKTSEMEVLETLRGQIGGVFS
jgi:hypothetical protein